MQLWLHIFSSLDVTIAVQFNDLGLWLKITTANNNNKKWTIEETKVVFKYFVVFLYLLYKSNSMLANVLGQWKLLIKIVLLGFKCLFEMYWGFSQESSHITNA